MRDSAGPQPRQGFAADLPSLGRLLPGDVHVFLGDPESQTDASLRTAFRLLDADERERAERFHFPVHRRLFVVAHGLLRTALAAYVGDDPARLRFRRTQSGKPELLTAAGAAPVRFSLSHTAGLVGCAITLDSEIGFDLEAIRVPAPLAIADRYFSDPELCELRALQPSDQHAHFFALWTLKEAYLKARSLGLSGGLGTFTTRALLEHSELVSCEAEGRAITEWTLQSVRLPNHFAAVAVRCPRRSVRLSVFPPTAL